MDNYDGATPWLKKQARWSIPDMTRAVHLQCKFCNGAEVFTEATDCVSFGCPLFPFRPGTARPEVGGVRRATRRATTNNLPPGSLGARAGRPQIREITPVNISAVGVAASSAAGASRRTNKVNL